MIMDGGNSDQSSPINDSNSGSWLQCWDSEDRSASGVNLELSSELDHLVEDKDIAARAVAFVVSSTRKGIVPLCADVATLFRSRRNLQAKLEHLKLENRALRRSHASAHTSTHTSVSTSPTPASLHSGSERCTCPHDGSTAHAQDKSSPCCSRCSSQCSSLMSDSPRLDKLPPSSLRRQKSPRLTRSSAFAVPHDADDAPTVVRTLAVVHRQPAPAARRKHARKHSLPEIVCEPDGNVQKVSPRVSAEVDAPVDVGDDGGGATPSTVAPPSDECLRDSYCKVLAENRSLSGELVSAQSEIAMLRARLKQLEHLDSKVSSSVKCCSQSDVRTVSDQSTRLAQQKSDVTRKGSVDGTDSSVTSSRGSTAGRPTGQSGGQSSGQSGGQSGGQKAEVEFLDGCCCNHCIGMTGVANCSRPELWLSGENCRLEIGRQVALGDGRRGRVRYLGHVDNMSQPGTMYAGIELDSPEGRHNGCVGGKVYFTCDKDRGIFLPLEDLLVSIEAQAAPGGSGGDAPAERSGGQLGVVTPARTKPIVPPKRLLRVLDHTARYVAAGGCHLKLTKSSLHVQNQLV